MTVHLVAFSDESMSRSRQLCAESAKRYGVDTVDYWHATEFRDTPVRTTDRGCGYWAWKPWIINDLMRSAIPCNDDVIIYSDAGVEFINNVNYIIDRMEQDIFLFGNSWEHAHWCKRDIVEAVWPYTYTPEPISVTPSPVGPEYKRVPWEAFGKQAQASVIFFRVSDYSKQFVAEWLKWCLFEDGRLIDDSPSRAPNHPEFQENRHDQAILTTLAYREGIKLHWWPASYNDGAFTYEKLPCYAGDDYPIMFNHHRKRNHEWENAA
jgi:hypothetical protein